MQWRLLRINTYVRHRIVACRPLLGNDREISNYKAAVSK
jgi:hypothetical protein